MTKTCVICKKQPVTGDFSRSFHKFPTNSELKQKWMEVIGIQEVKKNSAVCSDHFGDDSYHQTDGYTITRRLLSSAVPLVYTNNSVLREHMNKIVAIPTSYEVEVISGHKTCAIVKDEYSIDSPTNTNYIEIDIPIKVETSSCIDESEDYVNDIVCDADLISEPEDTETTTSEDNSMNSKRKQTMNNESTLPKKKFRFKDGFQPTQISREDFVSDEAWGRFVKLMRYKKRQIASAEKRSWRRGQKLSMFKELIKSLQDNIKSHQPDKNKKGNK